MSTASDARKAHEGQFDPARHAACKHDGLYWYSSPHDERGWLCVDCHWAPGEEPGYSPQHDRDHLRTKCWCILHDMVNAELVSVSNSDHGESLASQAERIARDARTLDQESIVAILARLCAADGKFWREQHESILAGNDNRRRCACGKRVAEVERERDTIEARIIGVIDAALHGRVDVPADLSAETARVVNAVRIAMRVHDALATAKAECERMRAVYEAAQKWRAVSLRTTRCNADDTDLEIAIDAALAAGEEVGW